VFFNMIYNKRAVVLIVVGILATLGILLHPRLPNQDHEEPMTQSTESFTDDAEEKANIISKVSQFMSTQPGGIFNDLSFNEPTKGQKITIFKGNNMDFKGDQTIFKARAQFGASGSAGASRYEHDQSINPSPAIFFEKAPIFDGNLNIFKKIKSYDGVKETIMDSSFFAGVQTNSEHLSKVLPDDDVDMEWNEEEGKYIIQPKIPEYNCSFDDKEGKNKEGCITSMWSAVNNASTVLNNQVCSCCCNKYLQKKETSEFTYVRLYDTVAKTASEEFKVTPGGEYYIDLRNRNHSKVILKQTNEKLESKLVYVLRNGTEVEDTQAVFSTTTTVLSTLDDVTNLDNKELYLAHFYAGCHQPQCVHKVIWPENNEIKKQNVSDFQKESNTSKYLWRFLYQGHDGANALYFIESVEKPGNYLFVNVNNYNDIMKTSPFVKYSSTTKQTFAVEFVRDSAGYLSGEFRLGLYFKYIPTQFRPPRNAPATPPATPFVKYMYLEDARSRNDLNFTFEKDRANITWKYMIEDTSTGTGLKWSTDLVVKKLKLMNKFIEAATPQPTELPASVSGTE
jgi:hypothetical protein